MIYALYLLVIGVLGLFLYFRWQYATLFHPKLYREDTFDERFRFLSVTSEDGLKLEGCIFEPKSYKSTLLYFGGRGQDSVGLLPKLSRCYPDFRIVTFNYRGYGKSEGKPDERHILKDALLVYEKVKKNFGEVEPVGYSLGCAVASYVAANTDLQKLFLIAPFASLKSLVQDVHGFTLPLLRYSFETCIYLTQTAAKVHIFVSRDDNIVPIKNVRRLLKCVKPELFLELDGLNHVEILCNEKVIDALEAAV